MTPSTTGATAKRTCKAAVVGHMSRVAVSGSGGISYAMWKEATCTRLALVRHSAPAQARTEVRCVSASFAGTVTLPLLASSSPSPLTAPAPESPPSTDSAASTCCRPMMDRMSDSSVGMRESGGSTVQQADCEGPLHSSHDQARPQDAGCVHVPSTPNCLNTGASALKRAVANASARRACALSTALARPNADWCANRSPKAPAAPAVSAPGLPASLGATHHATNTYHTSRRVGVGATRSQPGTSLGHVLNVPCRLLEQRVGVCGKHQDRQYGQRAGVGCRCQQARVSAVVWARLVLCTHERDVRRDNKSVTWSMTVSSGCSVLSNCTVQATRRNHVRYSRRQAHTRRTCQGSGGVPGAAIAAAGPLPPTLPCAACRQLPRLRLQPRRHTHATGRGACTVGHGDGGHTTRV